MYVCMYVGMYIYIYIYLFIYIMMYISCHSWEEQARRKNPKTPASLFEDCLPRRPLTVALSADSLKPIKVGPIVFDRY